MSAVRVAAGRPSAAVPVGPSPAEHRRYRRNLLVLTVLAVAVVALVLTYQFAFVTGSWQYTMNLRSRQLGALAVAGVSVGVSSVAFQTLAGSRILTPGVMGFDSLYVLIQTLMVFAVGTSAAALMPPAPRALVTTVLLTGFGLLVFWAVFRRGTTNLLALVLVGLVLGAMFSSLTSFISRMLTPDDYLTLQDVMFASFNTVDGSVLAAMAAVTALACVAMVPTLRRLDVLDLGHDGALTVGLSYRRLVGVVLVLITVLVATSTAMVGPMTFLGLIVANLARGMLATHRHRWLMAGAALIGVLCTVLGQFVVARLLGNTVPLSVVINVVGGGYFLILMLRTVRR
ncbi:petrobactin ABC transporter permease YclO [Gordonia sinesedis]